VGFLFWQDYLWAARPRGGRAGRLLRHLFFEEIEENQLSMRRLRKIILTAALAALSPSPLFACAACYGRSNDPLAHGVNWGILTLLAIVVLMLSSIATFFFVFLRRQEAQARKLEEDNLSEAQI
jgi:hypothetical protein